MNLLKTNPGKNEGNDINNTDMCIRRMWVYLLYMHSISFSLLEILFRKWRKKNSSLWIQLKQIEKLLNSKAWVGDGKRWNGKHMMKAYENRSIRWTFWLGAFIFYFLLFSERISGCVVKRMNATENLKRSPKIHICTRADLSASVISAQHRHSSAF